MNKSFNSIFKTLVCAGLTLSISAVSLTRKIPANAQAEIGAALAIAKLATEISDWINSPDFPFGAFLHLGSNQCRKISRYSRAIAALRRVEQEMSPEATLALDTFINGSDLRRRCVASVMAGNFNSLLVNLEAAVEAIELPSGTMTLPDTRNPLADFPVLRSSFYLSIHSDLQQAFGSDIGAASAHWIRDGVREGRVSSPAFDVRFYLGRHDDLQDAFGAQNYQQAAQHWSSNGMNEGRQSSPVFNVRYYLEQHDDLRRAFGDTGYQQAVEHWLNHGISEGRRGSQGFDARCYLAVNYDVANAYGADNYLGAIGHYTQFGRAEGRQVTCD